MLPKALATPALTPANDVSLAENSLLLERLAPEATAEVLLFLRQRPLHTVALVSLIQDNGLVSPLNRGVFYACRDLNGNLEGVALIGHATLMETASGRAHAALARIEQECPNSHLIIGEQDRMQEFWTYYSKTGKRMRRTCRESLLELRSPPEERPAVPGLRTATLSELDLVLPVQAQMAFEESGIDPLEVDPEGFRARCIRRIEKGRTWVVVENGELIFKADIVSETTEVIYLEGIWLDESKRGGDLGVRCMSELARTLFKRTQAICLLVNDNNKQAKRFYRKCGYLFRATYETMFLPQEEHFPQLFDSAARSAPTKGKLPDLESQG